MTLPRRKLLNISRNQTNLTAHFGFAICWRSDLRRHWQDAFRCHICKEGVLLLDVNICWSRTARQRTKHSFCLRMRRSDASILSCQIFAKACHTSYGKYTEEQLQACTLAMHRQQENSINKTSSIGTGRPTIFSSQRLDEKGGCLKSAV